MSNTAQEPGFAGGNTAPCFTINGNSTVYSRASMLSANKDDIPVSAWLRIASPGDVYKGGGGAAADFEITCVGSESAVVATMRALADAANHPDFDGLMGESLVHAMMAAARKAMVAHDQGGQALQGRQTEQDASLQQFLDACDEHQVCWQDDEAIGWISELMDTGSVTVTVGAQRFVLALSATLEG